MYVYRYIDKSDGIIKYVGVVTNDGISYLKQRIWMHSYLDFWCKEGAYSIDYISVCNKSECYSIESHLISLYNTWRYFNKAKGDHGLNSYLPNDFEWVHFCDTVNGSIIQSAFDKIINRNNKKPSKAQRIIDWISSKPTGTVFKTCEMLKDLGISHEQFERAKRDNRHLKIIFKNMMMERKGYYMIAYIEVQKHDSSLEYKIQEA